jgi:hypothetical protein
MDTMATKRGPFKYPKGQHQGNHVIWPGREGALEKFVHQSYGGLGKHKLANAHSAHSEDALTWSCFDCLAQVKQPIQEQALREMWKLAYDGAALPKGLSPAKIHVGHTYGTGRLKTEVDASIEGPGVLVFIEAKLYSPMSQSEPPVKPFNQIARKLQIGVQQALATNRDFCFILLDLAPGHMLRTLRPGVSLDEATTARGGGFKNKWLTAYWFDRYKSARGGSLTPIRQVLKELPDADLARVTKNMGWLTWADLFKVVLRAVVADRTSKQPREAG